MQYRSGEILEKQSYKRAQRTIRKLNAIRHKQAQKIDILCNDMVLANKAVIEQIIPQMQSKYIWILKDLILLSRGDIIHSFFHSHLQML